MPPLPSGLPDLISDDENLARFLTQSSHFTRIIAKLDRPQALYVACTRTRDQLLVTGVDPVSEFLDDLRK